MGVSFDWKDTDTAIEELNRSLKEAGGDFYETGDFIVISTSGDISATDRKELDSKGVTQKFQNKFEGFIDLVNDDSPEDFIDMYKSLFKQLGYKMKTDPRFKGGDTYGFNITPRINK